MQNSGALNDEGGILTFAKPKHFPVYVTIDPPKTVDQKSRKNDFTAIKQNYVADRMS